MPKRADRVPLDVQRLIGREVLFRVSGAVERDAAVDAWLRDEPRELRAIAQAWFECLRRCGADVRELIHDRCPVACVADAPFAYVGTFKHHVAVGFFHGAALADPGGLLEGSGKRMRHVKLRPDGEVDAAALSALIVAAYHDVKARLAD